jgi:hypothetical protein
MSDHGARALILAALALIAGGALLWWLAGRPSGVERIAEAVATAAPGDVIRIDDVVDHDWEELHVFAPYTAPHLVEAAVGRRVGEVRGLVRDGVMLLVLTDGAGRVRASGLVARAPVDWLPAASERPYPREGAVFRVVPGVERPELQPAAAASTG